MIWKKRSCECIINNIIVLISYENTGPLSDMAVPKDKRRLIACYNDGIIKVFSLYKKYVIKTIETNMYIFIL